MLEYRIFFKKVDAEIFVASRTLSVCMSEQKAYTEEETLVFCA